MFLYKLFIIYYLEILVEDILCVQRQKIWFWFAWITELFLLFLCSYYATDEEWNQLGLSYRDLQKI